MSFATNDLKRDAMHMAMQHFRRGHHHNARLMTSSVMMIMMFVCINAYYGVTMCMCVYFIGNNYELVCRRIDSSGTTPCWIVFLMVIQLRKLMSLTFNQRWKLTSIQSSSVCHTHNSSIPYYEHIWDTFAWCNNYIDRHTLAERERLSRMYVKRALVVNLFQ